MYAYDSHIYRTKYWVEPPIWEDEDGDLIEVGLVVKEINPHSKEYVRQLKIVYPDLHYVGRVVKCHEQGVYRGGTPENFPENYHLLN